MTGMDKQLPKRKPNRLANYDYSQNGVYFVTVCTKDKKCVLGKIISPSDVGEAALCLPKNHLSRYGIAVEKYINNVCNVYDGVTIDKYVIMPNHFHMLLVINSTNGRQGAASPTVGEIVKGIKSLSTKHTGADLFQRSFHDHIIRNDEDYSKIWEYIDTNPLKWELDKYYLNIT